jgi:alkanesulfonate monooxygenase SsuD/methylene tetrahydromethanopterin reductase-like flavin-dependent oxidoreductase (luciferase family)
VDAAAARPGELGLLLGSWPEGVPRRASFHEHVAVTAERANYALLLVGDHLVAASPNFDSLVWLTHLATVTARISIGTCLLQLALRDPVVVAKQLASIDVLSGGRLIVGVGVGGEFPAEWDAVEVDRRDRGRRTDEHLELVRQLWSGREVSFHGHYRTVERVFDGVDACVTPVLEMSEAPGRAGRARRSVCRDRLPHTDVRRGSHRPPGAVMTCSGG